MSDNSRQAIIRRFVGTRLDELLDLSQSIRAPCEPGESSEPTWLELRDAIVTKLFEIEATMASEAVHAEWVRENCT